MSVPRLDTLPPCHHDTPEALFPITLQPGAGRDPVEVGVFAISLAFRIKYDHLVANYGEPQVSAKGFKPSHF